MRFDHVLAALALAACVALLLRLVIGSRRRARLDAVVRRGALAVRGVVTNLRHRHEAARVAEETIARARKRDGEWEGNVYKPKSFRKPPRDKMH